MRLSYWRNKWKKNEIAFHSPDVNSYLLQFHHHLEPIKDKIIFVPLCGKSLDMIWFLQKDATVIGVELSDIAISDFFHENDIAFQKQNHNKFNLYLNEKIKLFSGNFFDLKKKDVAKIDIVYDKGALIALPGRKRVKYVENITKLLPENSTIFLIVLEFKSPFKNKPPFSITHKEIESLYSKNYQINLLHEDKNFEFRPGLKELGFCEPIARVFLMKKKLNCFSFSEKAIVDSFS